MRYVSPDEIISEYPYAFYFIHNLINYFYEHGIYKKDLLKNNVKRLYRGIDSRFTLDDKHTELSFQSTTWKLKVAETFGEILEEFKNLQHCFVFDQSHPKSRSIVLPYDLDTWQKLPTDYQICTRIDKFEPTYNQLILQRRRGNMKNLIRKTRYHLEEAV